MSSLCHFCPGDLPMFSVSCVAIRSSTQTPICPCHPHSLSGCPHSWHLRSPGGSENCHSQLRLQLTPMMALLWLKLLHSLSAPEWAGYSEACVGFPESILSYPPDQGGLLSHWNPEVKTQEFDFMLILQLLLHILPTSSSSSCWFAAIPPWPAARSCLVKTDGFTYS